MPTQRRGIIWLLDSPTGHLAIAHRSWWLQKALQEPTRLFRKAEDLTAALPSHFPPTAILIGYCELKPAIEALRLAELQTVPVLITDFHGRWPREGLRPNIYFADDTQLSYPEAVKWFAREILGRSTDCVSLATEWWVGGVESGPDE